MKDFPEKPEMVSMVSKKTKPKIVWHYGTLSAISGIFFLYISYEGLSGKGVQCAIVP
jgi:hypothetical protein